MATLLVVGSGQDVYREYTFRAARGRHSLVLLQDAPVTWQGRYVVDAAQAPIADSAAACAAARALDRQHHFDGIFTFEEASIETTAVIAGALGLPFLDPATARRCRDKREMRLAFARAGVPSAASHVASSPADAAGIADRLGYPVVFKPRTLASSMGVIRVDRAADIPTAFAVAAATSHPRFAREPNILVEEYLDGPEVSVESVVVDGVVHSVAITRKRLGLAPYFEELGHIVSATEPLPDEATLHNVVAQAHAALGVRTGATHAEVRLTRTGPRMIELGARLGGDLIPYLVHLATGVDLARAALDVAAGEQVSLAPTRARAAAIRFVYPKHDMRVRRLHAEPAASDLPWLDQITWEVSPGDVVRLPPREFGMRLGFVVVTGADQSACDRQVEPILSLLRIEGSQAPLFRGGDLVQELFADRVTGSRAPVDDELIEVAERSSIEQDVGYAIEKRLIGGDTFA
jgi:biotin carboxylase